MAKGVNEGNTMNTHSGNLCSLDELVGDLERERGTL
jgi:hypothetical protein